MRDDISIFYYLGLLGQLGLTIMINILAGVAIYKLVEHFFGQNIPVFIVCVFLGICSGFYNAYRLIYIDKRNNK